MSGIPSIPPLIFPSQIQSPPQPPPLPAARSSSLSPSPNTQNPIGTEENKLTETPSSNLSPLSPYNSSLDPFSTPEGPRKHYRIELESSSSQAVKPSSGSGERYKQAPDSSSLSKAISTPTTLKISKLELDSKLQGICSDSNPKWTPIREAPGDISSRYCSQERSPQHQTSSVRFSIGPDQSPLENKKRKSPATSLFLRTKGTNTPFASPRESSSSSSPPLLSPPHFEVHAPELHRLLDKKSKFSEETAAKEIICCLKKEVGTLFILNLLSHYHRTKKEERIERRWNLLLTAMLLRPECTDLIYLFLDKENFLPLDFANLIVFGFLYKNTPPIQIAHIFSLCTQKDLQKEKPDATLFRANALSSSLISTYGHHLLKNLFKHLEKNIKKFWKRQPPSSLCLNREKVRQNLLKSRKGFALLNEKEQENLCTQTIHANESHCREFCSLFLENFYQYRLPEACQDLLAVRRNQIYTYLFSQKISSSSECEEDFPETENPRKNSAIHIGGDLFLRTINPCLIEIGSTPSEKDSLVILTKVIQALSNQIPFGEGGKNQELLFLNDIYEQFKADNNEYIEKNFPLRLSPQRHDF